MLNSLTKAKRFFDLNISVLDAGDDELTDNLNRGLFNLVEALEALDSRVKKIAGDLEDIKKSIPSEW